MEKKKRLDEINTILNRLEPLEDKLKKAQQFIKMATELLKASDEVARLMSLAKTINEKQEQFERMEYREKKLQSARETLDKAVKAEDTALVKWTTAKPSVCPLCGQKWDNHKGTH